MCRGVFKEQTTSNEALHLDHYEIQFTHICASLPFAIIRSTYVRQLILRTSMFSPVVKIAALCVCIQQENSKKIKPYLP